jgi:arylsulfatase B
MLYRLLAVFVAILITYQVDAKPNIVIVITDDQGYGDLSCHGNPVLKTPHLDKLSSESVRLNDYHVAPTCSPTRAALLTGHWTDRTGVWHTIMGRSLIRENEVTIGQIFSDGGYATGMFGKWHLGDNYPYRPEDRGFQEVLRHGGGGVGQTPDYWDNAYFDGAYYHNSKPEPVKGYCTDVYFDYARRFITAQKAAGKPFLAYIATNAPHGPMHAPEEYAKPYEKLGVSTAHFMGMVANIDDNVGKMRKWLADEGLAEDTIFIFTTDNGTAGGRKVYDGGMRGAKGSEYDGGHRVPFFMHWPKGGMTGRDVEPITAHVDIVPTLIDICDIPAPKGVTFDGTSIYPLLKGTAKNWPDRMLVTDSQRVVDPIKWRKTAVMSSKWRLVNGKELYDIKADPKQQKNVAAQHPEVMKRMTDFYDAWWTELEPTFKQDAQLYVGHPAENPARLTCHDWIGRLVPWNQGHVRKGPAYKKNQKTGFWNIKVHQAGDYEISLRRWPEETGKAITAALPNGSAVPGTKAFRDQPGNAINVVKASIDIAGQQAEKPIPKDAAEVTFKLKLGKGITRLTGLFETADGTVYGAYYAYVKRL